MLQTSARAGSKFHADEIIIDNSSIVSIVHSVDLRCSIYIQASNVQIQNAGQVIRSENVPLCGWNEHNPNPFWLTL